MNTEIHIREREAITLTGVSEVLSFDSDFISAASTLGKVEIEGDGLKILSMSSDTGNLSVVGRIDGVYYSSSQKEKKGFFSRRAK